MLDGSEQYEHVRMVTLLCYFKYSHIFCINTLTVSNDNSSFRKFINLYTYNNYLSGMLHNPIVNFFIQSSIKKIEPCRKFKIPDASNIDQLRGVEEYYTILRCIKREYFLKQVCTFGLH